MAYFLDAIGFFHIANLIHIAEPIILIFAAFYLWNATSRWIVYTILGNALFRIFILFVSFFGSHFLKGNSMYKFTDFSLAIDLVLKFVFAVALLALAKQIKNKNLNKNM